LVGSESGYCVRVDQHVYPRTVVSVSCWHFTNLTKRAGLVQTEHRHLIEFNLFSSCYGWNITRLALNNNHALISLRGAV